MNKLEIADGLWDIHSTHIADNNFSLDLVAGRDVVFKQDFLKAIQSLEPKETENYQWRSIAANPPAKGQDIICLVFRDGKYFKPFSATYLGDGAFTWRGLEVTHETNFFGYIKLWIPLPELPIINP